MVCRGNATSEGTQAILEMSGEVKHLARLNGFEVVRLDSTVDHAEFKYNCIKWTLNEHTDAWLKYDVTSAQFCGQIYESA